MKVLIYSLSAFFLLVLATCIGCQKSEEAIDIFPKDTMDLGSVKVGTNKVVKIELNNPTDQQVRLISVKGDCNCLVTNDYPSSIYPGKKHLLTVTYDSQYDKKIRGVVYRNVVVQIDKKPFIQFVKLKINIT